MRSLLPVTLLSLLLTVGCEKPPATVVKHEVGERFNNGPLAYVVVEANWRGQLGEGFNLRSPQNRFLVISLSVTNGSNSDISVPALTLVGSNGQSYTELSDSTGVPNALGLLRSAGPSQTLQGRVVFDVPLGTYRLKLPDAGESGYEKYLEVEIPLTLDNQDVQAPIPGELK